MQHARFPPDDPREWLNRAESNLVQAREGIAFADVYLEDLCFNAQQAAEKAIKAVLLHLGVGFPFVHDLAQLVALLEEAGQTLPEGVRAATRLSPYAVLTRYPGALDPVTREAYGEALRIATAVVQWAHSIITPPP